MTRMSSVSAGKKSGKKAMPSGKIEHMHLKPMDDGTFTSETRFQRPATKEAMMADYDSFTHKATHPSADHMADHVRAMFGGKAGKKKQGKEGSPKEEATESKAEAQAEGDED